MVKHFFSPPFGKICFFVTFSKHRRVANPSFLGNDFQAAKMYSEIFGQKINRVLFVVKSLRLRLSDFMTPGFKRLRVVTHHLSNEKRAPGCLGYIGDTTQLCSDYNKQ